MWKVSAYTPLPLSNAICIPSCPRSFPPTTRKSLGTRLCNLSFQIPLCSWSMVLDCQMKRGCTHLDHPTTHTHTHTHTHHTLRMPLPPRYSHGRSMIVLNNQHNHRPPMTIQRWKRHANLKCVCVVGYVVQVCTALPLRQSSTIDHEHRGIWKDRLHSLVPMQTLFCGKRKWVWVRGYRLQWTEGVVCNQLPFILVYTVCWKILPDWIEKKSNYINVQCVKLNTLYPCLGVFQEYYYNSSDLTLQCLKSQRHWILPPTYPPSHALNILEAEHYWRTEKGLLSMLIGCPVFSSIGCWQLTLVAANDKGCSNSPHFHPSGSSTVESRNVYCRSLKV